MKRVRLVKRTSKLTMTSLDQALYFSCLQRVNVCVRGDCVTVIQAKQCLLYIIQQFCNISSQALKTKAQRNIWFSEINNEGTFYVLIRLTRWIIAFFNVSWNCPFNEWKKKMGLALITVYVTATLLIASIFAPGCSANKNRVPLQASSSDRNERCSMYRSAFVCVLYVETLSKILEVTKGTSLPLLFWICSDFRCF